MTALIISGLICGWIFINRRLSIKFELIPRISNLRIIWVISKSKLSLISRQSWQTSVHFPNLTEEASCDAIATGRSPNPHAPVLHEIRNCADWRILVSWFLMSFTWNSCDKTHFFSNINITMIIIIEFLKLKHYRLWTVCEKEPQTNQKFNSLKSGHYRIYPCR